MIRVQTGSRLHFGILSWNPELPRQFGGVGVMIDEPGIELIVESARATRATGPLSERALVFAQRLMSAEAGASFPHADLRDRQPADQAFQITIHRAPPEHAGLGTGTQLALAVGRAMTVATGQAREPSAVELAAKLGRGRRSAVGVHGFAHGGFLVEAGKLPGEALSPLVARTAVPEAWRFVVVIPRGVRGLCGCDEEQALAHLPPIAPRVTEHLCRVVLQGMLPGVAQADFPVFGESLYEFNRRVGECFAPAQGGPYASGLLAEVVDFLRSQGCLGAGQSSWGPALFALADDHDRADAVRRKVQARFSFGDDEIICTPARNRGAAACAC